MKLSIESAKSTTAVSSQGGIAGFVAADQGGDRLDGSAVAQEFGPSGAQLVGRNQPETPGVGLDGPPSTGRRGGSGHERGRLLERIHLEWSVCHGEGNDELRQVVSERRQGEVIDIKCDGAAGRGDQDVAGVGVLIEGDRTLRMVTTEFEASPVTIRSQATYFPPIASQRADKPGIMHGRACGHLGTS